METMKAPQPPSRVKPSEITKNLLTSSKSEGPGGAPLGRVIGFFIGMGMVGFCFEIGLMRAVKTVNNLEDNKMEEENRQQVQQEPQQVTMKDPKKVEVGKRLAAISHKTRETKKREEQAQLERTTRRGFASGVNQYYGIGAVLAVGVIGGLGYYIYQAKKGGRGATASTSGEQPSNPQQDNPKPCPQPNKFEMD